MLMLRLPAEDLREEVGWHLWLCFRETDWQRSAAQHLLPGLAKCVEVCGVVVRGLQGKGLLARDSGASQVECALGGIDPSEKRSNSTRLSCLVALTPVALVVLRP